MTNQTAAAAAAAPAESPAVPWRFADPMLALGVASHFVARQPGFDAFPARVLIETLEGQIARNQYLLVVEGQEVTGYAGWARVDRATADVVSAGGEAPRNDQLAALAESGTIVWLMTFATTNRDAVRVLQREMRALNPGLELFGVRYGDAGRRVLEKLRFAG
jgi:hemolysin-activating ACP:hemolysin acyltransferase